MHPSSIIRGSSLHLSNHRYQIAKPERVAQTPSPLEFTARKFGPSKQKCEPAILAAGVRAFGSPPEILVYHPAAKDGLLLGSTNDDSLESCSEFANGAWYRGPTPEKIPHAESGERPGPLNVREKRSRKTTSMPRGGIDRRLPPFLFIFVVAAPLAMKICAAQSRTSACRPSSTRRTPCMLIRSKSA